MNRFRSFIWLPLLTVPAALFAQPGQDEAPERGVARISLIQGDVSVRRGDSNEVIAAAVNAPVVIQDRILTSYSSRAELQFDFANYLRMAADTDLKLVELEYRRFMIQLARGTVQWRMNQDNAADVDLSTPSVSVRPVKWGDYRVTVRDDGTTEITVRRGEAEIYSPRGVQRLGEGRTMLVRGSQGDPEFQLINETPEDDFDRWNRRRDADFERSTSRRYLPQGMTGWEELDAHGGWVDVAPYGRVWRPRVAVGWSPYRHGRWTWIDWYGWTWVSYDPFGWAPFHYGSWFNYAGGWHWWPGTVGPRVWWRPAVVSWFGWGGGVNINIGFGRCWGWVPLAPFEPFHPWYGRGYYRGWGHGHGYGGNVTIVNNYNIINNYRNARIQGAVHGIPADQFGRGGYRGGEYLRASEANLREASLMRGELPASPDRGALAYSDRRVNDTGGVRGANYDRGFYARRPVESAERIPFEQQRQGLKRSAELTGVRGGGGASGGNGFPPAREGAPAVRDGALAGREGSSGWRRFGEPSGSGVAPGVQPSSGEASHGFRGDSGVRGGGYSGQGAGQRSEESRSGSGWRRFGEPSGSDAVRGGGSRRGDSASPSYSRPDSQPSYSGSSESSPSYRQPSYRTDSERRQPESGRETRQPESRQSDSYYRRSDPSGGYGAGGYGAGRDAAGRDGAGSGTRGGGSYGGSYGNGGSGGRGSSPSDGGGYRGGESSGGGGMRGGGGGGGASANGGGGSSGESMRGGGASGGGGSRGGSGGSRNQ